MEQQYYKFKISPENIKGDLIYVPFTGETDITTYVDPCCPITAQTITTHPPHAQNKTPHTYPMPHQTNNPHYYPIRYIHAR